MLWPKHAFWLAAGLIASTIGAGSPRAADAPHYRGRPLAEVLQEFEARGLDLIYSSAVVGGDLRVTVEPSGTEPRELLLEILEPLGLEARPGPSGSISIVPRIRESGNLKGRVVSAGNGQPIGGAVVSLPAAGLNASSGSDGSFEIRGIPAGAHDVVVEGFGFTRKTIAGVQIVQNTDTALSVTLKLHLALAAQIVVTDTRLSVVQDETDTRRTLDTKDAVLVPTIGGDISRVVELLPGVAASDNTAAFHVRGSGTDDVALILDGLELYDPYHLRSFQSPFSVIDGKIVDKIDFFGGGFTAELGDRHGGFVEISTLVPEEKSVGEVEMGTLNSRGSYRATLPNANGSWLASVRAWYPEALRETLETHAGLDLGGDARFDTLFGDAYVKAAFTVSPRTLVSAHLLLAYDRVTLAEHAEQDEGFNESANASTRSGDLWVRGFHAWSEVVSSETVLSTGRIERVRDGVSAPEEERVLVEDDRVVNFAGLKHDATWEISGTHALRTGIDIRWLDGAYRYSNQPEGDPVPTFAARLDPKGSSFAAYAAHRARVSDKLATEVGLRWDRQEYTDDNQVSPRFNAVWRASPKTEVRLALGRFNQSQRIHELHVEDEITEFRRAEVSEQADVTLQHRFRGGLRLRADGYYRTLSHLRPRCENLFEPIELFPETAPDRECFAPSRARLRGVELLLQGAAGRPLSWWASYARSSAEDVIEGESVPRSWDQPHAFKGLIGHRFGERWAVSLAGTAHTGWPTTPKSGPATPGPRNSDRFDGYLRLDAKARREFALARGRLALTLEIVNLTDRDNACCVDEFVFEPRPDGSVDVQRELGYWLGFTPSFSVLWEF